MDPLSAAIALLRRFLELEQGAHSHEEWTTLDDDTESFLASYGHLAPEE